MSAFYSQAGRVKHQVKSLIEQQSSYYYFTTVGITQLTGEL